MAIIEKSALLVHKDSATADQVWIYPITLAENVILDDGQMDVVVTDMKTNIANLSNIATTSAKGLMSSADKTKLDGIATGANNYVHPSHTAKTAGLYKITVNTLGHVTAATAVSKADITGLGIPGSDTTYVVATASADGLMSKADKTKLDGIATGANNYVHPAYTAKTAGLYKITVDAQGHVSAATAVAKADITALGIPSTNTTYSVATTTTNGLMSSADKTKLDGMDDNANNYVHPAYTAKAAGLYKVTVDSSGHVSAATAVAKADITALGIPGTNTTYSVATTTANGLMSSADKTKLDGIATGANKTVVDSTLSDISTNPVQNKVIKTAIDAVEARVTGILADAPEAYDTLKEISDYIATHSTEYDALLAITNNKVDKVTGKGLSTNDFTAAYKTKLDGIETGANKYTHPAYTAKTSGLYKVTVDTTGHVSATTAVAKADITALGIPASDTTYSVATTTANGLMSSADKVKLNGIATGANNYVHPSHDAQESGLYKITVDAQGHVSEVVAVAKADITALGIPSTNTTYAVATTTTDGLMSKADKTKLDGVATGANKYTHPAYTAKAAGLYKVTVDATGHVSAATAVAKADITALGIPASDTTYDAATTDTDGLMSSADKVKLNGIATGANNYVHPAYTAKTAGLYKVTVDASGHVSAATAVAKADITALGIPSTNTTYSVATTTANGLMSSADKTKLDGIASGAQVNTITGVKGSSESSYRTGNVSISPTDLGLGKIDNTSDSEKSVASAAIWTTTRNINGMLVNGSANNSNYGSCATAAGTAAKVVACTGFGLVTGAEITVKFTVTNTAASPTLNVNSTGAKPIYYRNAAISAGYLAAGRTYTFRYNGTQYELVGDIDTNTTYSVATTTANGLMSSADKAKLDGIATGANKYTHPAYTAKTSGLYKITVDASGHVSAATAVAKADITALGIPSTNTTYSVATTTANGLMSAADKVKLNGLENVNFDIDMGEELPTSVTKETYFLEYTIEA